MDGWRDVSLLSADQALIVSGSDHSFPSTPGSSHLASWSWTREPSRLSIGSQLGRVATGSEWRPVELWGVRTSSGDVSRRGDEEQGQVSAPVVTRCQLRLSDDVMIMSQSGQMNTE